MVKFVWFLCDIYVVESEQELAKRERQMNTEYVIGLFGRISVRRGDQLLVAFPTKKVAELLLALALHQGQRLPRKDVIKLLWPGAAGGRASNRLSATLYMLRRTLESHFGETAARLIQTGEGQLWLEGSVKSDLGSFERNWVGFRDATDDHQRLNFGKLVTQSYSGHLGADLNGKWYEPIQSLWASRWTEAVLSLVSMDSIPLDSGLEKLAKVQPILSVTRTMVLQYGDRIGQPDLLTSWNFAVSDEGTRRHSGHYYSFSRDDVGLLARRPTVTAVVVERSIVPALKTLVDQAQPQNEWSGSSQIFCARNPLFAQRLVRSIRLQHPTARIYVSTEVADLENRDQARLLSWLSILEPGETRLNAASAALIAQHEQSVVMERPLGSEDYRLV